MNIELFEHVIWGNTVTDLLIALGIFAFFTILVRIGLQFFVLRLKAVMQRTGTKVDDTFVQILENINFLSYIAIGLAAASQGLMLPLLLKKVIMGFAIIMVVYESVSIIQSLVLLMVGRVWLKDRTAEAEQLNVLLSVLIRFVLWSVGLMLVLSNLGIDVTSLVASLGIGGMAMALASQGVLTDLFSAFALYSDKPFRIGDFIIVGEHMGTVRHIGLKTTRIEALSGEEVIIPNKELTESRVRNFKRMQRRRIEFRFNIELMTPAAKLEKVSGLIRGIFEGLERTTLDRVHLKEIAEKSFIYEVVYSFASPDYNQYMDTQERINLQILEVLKQAGVSLADFRRPYTFEEATE